MEGAMLKEKMEHIDDGGKNYYWEGGGGGGGGGGKGYVPNLVSAANAGSFLKSLKWWEIFQLTQFIFHSAAS